MTLIAASHRMSITEATRRGISGLIAETANANIVLERHGEAVACVVGMETIESIGEAQADLRDLALVLSRAGSDTGERTSLDEVLVAFGLTRDQLDALPAED